MKPGDQIGGLTAVKLFGKNSLGFEIWEFKCVCGNFCNVLKHNVECGNQKSCGCGRGIGLKKMALSRWKKRMIEQGSKV